MQTQPLPHRCRYDVPLVADIHFQPAVAMMVAEAFEKVRINPGNFVDGRKSFEQIDYDDPAEFEAERAHIEEVRSSAHICEGLHAVRLTVLEDTHPNGRQNLVLQNICKHLPRGAQE